MQWSRRIGAWGVTAGAACVALFCGVMVRSLFPLPSLSLALADKSAKAKSEPATAKATTIDGAEVAVLMIDGNEVLQLTATVGGLSPLERATIVAQRVNSAIAKGVSPREVKAREDKGVWKVVAADEVLITIDAEEARRAGLTPSAQAARWADSLAAALEKHYAKSGEVPGNPAAASKPEEPNEDKWVPIVSVLEGLKVGVARVTGPRSKVHLVQAVAQLETHFKDIAEIDVYLPISTKSPGEKLAIVHGASVTGLGDFDL
jgi:hypothetical protein